MSNRSVISTLVASVTSIVLLTVGCVQRNEKGPTGGSADKVEHEDAQGFYTCPMHPQVHEHKPGKCPICHMNLVKVLAPIKNASPTPNMALTKNESSNDLSVTDQQLRVAGISKYTVVKKDLVFSLSVAGRVISSREVSFQVYESDLRAIKPGNEFFGSATSAPDEKLTGKIRTVDNIADPSSRTVRVIGTLTKAPATPISDGGFHGEIISLVKNQIAIPEEAVLHAGKKDLVYIISQENELRSVQVQLGRKSNQEYQILSGLSAGDVISAGPNFLIDSEAKIRGGQ